MPLGLLGLAVSVVSEPTATMLFAWAMDIIDLILWTGEHLGRLMPVPRPPIVWVYLCYLGLFLAFFVHREQTHGEQSLAGLYEHIHRAILGIICLSLMIIPVAFYYHQRTLPLIFDFISVGQGDSILITKGAQAVLIDAGGSASGFDTGRFVVGPHLLRRGITRLDLAVLTHSHPDHAGGMPFILERFSVGQVWTNVGYAPGFEDVIRISALKSIPVSAVSRGDELNLNDMKIKVLHPQIQHITAQHLDLNLHSIVLKIGDANMTGLFMADANRFGELSLVHGDADLKADVLKVAHHGSTGSCLDLFLKAVSPRMAVITCGYANPYGMPSTEVLDRLHAKGIKIYRTDRNGEVQIIAKHAKIVIKLAVYRAEKG